MEGHNVYLFSDSCSLPVNLRLSCWKPVFLLITWHLAAIKGNIIIVSNKTIKCLAHSLKVLNRNILITKPFFFS